MKGPLLLVGLFLTTLSANAQASETDHGRNTQVIGARGVTGVSSSEASKILIACMNDPKFETYYKTCGKSTINVVDLPTDLQLSQAIVLGRKLRTKTDSDTRNGSISNYFRLGNIKQDGQQVSVSLSYFYGNDHGGYKVVMVDMNLVHNGDQYQIVNSNFNGDLL
jgi:hypothetical protein